jgi:hypothetical protein
VIQSQDKILHFTGNEARVLLSFYNQCNLISSLASDAVEGLELKGGITRSSVSYRAGQLINNIRSDFNETFTFRSYWLLIQERIILPIRSVP